MGKILLLLLLAVGIWAFGLSLRLWDLDLFLRPGKRAWDQDVGLQAGFCA